MTMTTINISSASAALNFATMLNLDAATIHNMKYAVQAALCNMPINTRHASQIDWIINNATGMGQDASRGNQPLS